MEYNNGQQLEMHILSYGKKAGESRSGTPNQTRHNSRKLLWRTLSHGNSLGPAHKVEPRIRRAMAFWSRYNTALPYGVGGAQNANMQKQNTNEKTMDAPEIKNMHALTNKTKHTLWHLGTSES